MSGWRQLVGELHARIETLEEHVALQRNISDKQEKIITSQKELIDRQKKEIAGLERRLRAYENPHTPPSKSKIKPPKKESSGKLGAPVGHPKYDRKEPEPTGSMEYIEETCPDCKATLGKPIKTERFLEEEIPEPQPIEVIEHLVNHYECPRCKKHITAKNNATQSRFGAWKYEVSNQDHTFMQGVESVDKILLKKDELTVWHPELANRGKN